MKCFFLILAVLALSGCATKPVQKLPYLVPEVPPSAKPGKNGEPPKDAPVEIIFIRPEARDYVHP